MRGRTISSEHALIDHWYLRALDDVAGRAGRTSSLGTLCRLWCILRLCPAVRPGRQRREQAAVNTRALIEKIEALPPERIAEVEDFVDSVRSEAEEDSAGYMVSLRKNVTGVDNTIFVSTKGYGRHAPRIKIAIDPPDSFNETCKSASMAMHDFGIVGEYMAPRLVEQAKVFIERNRDVLLGYWNGEFDTVELLKRLRRP